MLAKLKTRLANLTPAQTLFFLSPLLGEVVSAYQSPLDMLNPLNLVITIMPYGCGALIVRELLVRCHKGWISLVVLALAFGLFFEGIVTRVIFNPNWKDLGELGEYTHRYGVNWTLAVGIVHFQAAVSIISAILLAEMIFPAQRHDSWITTGKLIRCALVLPGWTFVIGLFVRFVPPLGWALGLVGLTALLIALALLIPAEPRSPHQRLTPRPAAFGIVGGVGMTLIMIGTYVLPTFKHRPPMEITLAALLILVAAELITLTVMNNGGAAWTDRHRLALVIGFLAFFIAFGVGQDLGGFTGRSVTSLVTIWQLRRLWRIVAAREQGDRSDAALVLAD